VVATNHSEFSGAGALALLAERAAEGCLVVDPWNALGAAQVFGSVNDAVERARELAREPAAQR
jgi:hypothetical protein